MTVVGPGTAQQSAAPQSTARRLRLGVDFHSFDGIFQGSRSHLLGLYRQAIVQAPDIDFIFLLAEPDRLRQAHPEFSRPNVQLATLPQRPGVWRLLWQLAAMQRRHRLDLLHVQYRLPVFQSAPCICTLHDVLFETHPQYFSATFRRIARWSARLAIRRASVILTVSEYSRGQIHRHYPIDSERVILTPNAVDPLIFHPRPDGAPVQADAAVLLRWNLSPGGYICSLGRLEPRKNHAGLVQAYARLPATALPLVIVGQRDFAYAEIFELIRRLELTQRVRILEDVSDTALPVVLRHAQIMAYPSFAEGFGMPVLEALASGVPVVTSNTTSLPEISGDAAWQIAPDDVDDLAATLTLALEESPAARQARIRRGLDQSARFSWADSAASLLKALRKITPDGR